MNVILFQVRDLKEEKGPSLNVFVGPLRDQLSQSSWGS